MKTCFKLAESESGLYLQEADHDAIIGDHICEATFLGRRIELLGSQVDCKSLVDYMQGWSVGKDLSAGHIFTPGSTDKKILETFSRMSAFLAFQEGLDIAGTLAIHSAPGIVDDRGRSLLHLAIDSGDQEAVEQLIEKKESLNLPDGSGETPFELAVDKEQDEMAWLLVSNGCFDDPENQPTASKLEDISHIVCNLQHEPGHAERIEKLTNMIKSADPRMFGGPDDLGKEIFFRGHSAEICRELMKKGLDVSKISDDESGALHLVVTLGNRQLVESVIAAMPSAVNDLDCYGRTPLKVLKETENSPEIAEVLLRSGGGQKKVERKLELLR